MDFFTYGFSCNYTYFSFWHPYPALPATTKQYETRETAHFTSCECCHAAISHKKILYIYTHI